MTGNKLTDHVSDKPSHSVTDECIVAALRETSLWSHFRTENPEPSVMKARRILNSSMASFPRMSLGQTQMFALTRAIIQLQVLNTSTSLATGDCGSAKPILLLDEATSSLDPKTEFVMRSIIQKQFAERGHTVISITHRLSGATEHVRSGRDIVALLSRGRVERIGKVEDILGTRDESEVIHT